MTKCQILIKGALVKFAFTIKVDQQLGFQS